MKVIARYEAGPIILAPDVHGDSRGYFLESFNNEEFKKETGLDITFVQDNESKSAYGTLRGLHFQKPPYAQSKLVRVVKGAAMDVIVDIRKGSPTYGQYFSAYLSEKNHYQFFVPQGFAHGFVALEDDTIFQYKCDNYYNKESEGAISWETEVRMPRIDSEAPQCSGGIPWDNLVPLKDIKLSDKDKTHPFLYEFDSPFTYEDNKEEIDEQ